MGNLNRLDAELVRRNYARSRAEAVELIRSGRVFLDGVAVTKPARQVNRSSALLVKKTASDNYASRGAYKLIGALEYLGDDAPQVKGIRALDAGASTGGFTDVLLRRGAEHVVAVDVGYGQILWRLREDPRVTVLERTNVRTLDPNLVAPAPTLIVGDLSFISLTLVLPALVRAAAEKADFLLMVKPQFEVGKNVLGAKGVVRDLKLHFAAIAKVALAAQDNGLKICAAAPSPLPGPAGNIEYFLHLHKNGIKNEASETIIPTRTEKNCGQENLALDPNKFTSNSYNLLSAEENLAKLGELTTAQIAAAIFAGPAADAKKNLTLLELPEKLQPIVDIELEKHAKYLAQAEKSENTQ